MCGRFTQTKSREEVIDQLADVELPPLFHGRYNIAPTQKVAVIKQQTPTLAEECIWGFQINRNSFTTENTEAHGEQPSENSVLSSKASGKNTAQSLVINARSETLTERPTFRNLLKLNRCLIPADGFYEWKDRQPYYFQLPHHSLFAFAGLWNKGRCVIITCAADQNMQGIHHRMPIILPPNRWADWLENFQPEETPELEMRAVSKRVNKVSFDDPACLYPGEIQTDLFD